MSYYPFQRILVDVLEIYPLRGCASQFHQQMRIQSSLVKLMTLCKAPTPTPPHTHNSNRVLNIFVLRQIDSLEISMC